MQTQLFPETNNNLLRLIKSESAANTTLAWYLRENISDVDFLMMCVAASFKHNPKGALFYVDFPNFSISGCVSVLDGDIIDIDVYRTCPRTGDYVEMLFGTALQFDNYVEALKPSFLKSSVLKSTRQLMVLHLDEIIELIERGSIVVGLHRV